MSSPGRCFRPEPALEVSCGEHLWWRFWGIRRVIFLHRVVNDGEPRSGPKRNQYYRAMADENGLFICINRTSVTVPLLRG
jgi:hypothetical protein